jgi:peptidoglycan/LPS O-acetylase OafA/YrhL
MMLRPEKMVATVARRRGNEKVVLWVHLLRAAAALAVMIAHAHQSALEIGIGDYVPDFPIGAAGVDLFFVISGFVMVYSSEPLFAAPGGSTTFFMRRLARIVPGLSIIKGIRVLEPVSGCLNKSRKRQGS